MENIVQPLILCPSYVVFLLPFVFYAILRVVIPIFALLLSYLQYDVPIPVLSYPYWNILLEDQQDDSLIGTLIFGH